MTKLSERERLFVIIGGVLLLGMLLFLGVRSLLNSMEGISSESSSLEESLLKIKRAGREYKILQNYRAGGTGSTLEAMVPFLENLVNSRNLRDRLSGMTPRDNDVEKEYTKRSVSMSFRNLTGQEIMGLIKEIENNSSALYQVESFSVHSVSKKIGYFNANFTIAAFQKKK